MTTHFLTHCWFLACVIEVGEPLLRVTTTIPHSHSLTLSKSLGLWDSEGMWSGGLYLANSLARQVICSSAVKPKNKKATKFLYTPFTHPEGNLNNPFCAPALWLCGAKQTTPLEIYGGPGWLVIVRHGLTVWYPQTWSFRCSFRSAGIIGVCLAWVLEFFHRWGRRCQHDVIFLAKALVALLGSSYWLVLPFLLSVFGNIFFLKEGSSLLRI